MNEPVHCITSPGGFSTTITDDRELLKDIEENYIPGASRSQSIICVQAKGTLPASLKYF
jgi:hypothetical protein